MREITGWSKEEIEELKRVKDALPDDGAMNIIYGILRGAYKHLYKKYINIVSEQENQNIKPEQENQMAKDIIDYFEGAARFPNKRYRVILPDGNILMFDDDEGYFWRAYVTNNGFSREAYANTKVACITENQIKDYNPDLMPFAVEVSDD